MGVASVRPCGKRERGLLSASAGLQKTPSLGSWAPCSDVPTPRVWDFSAPRCLDLLTHFLCTQHLHTPPMMCSGWDFLLGRPSSPTGKNLTQASQTTEGTCTQ